ncbi:MAG: hypothetical protein ACXVHW_07075 [Methanobacterium sp.]
MFVAFAIIGIAVPIAPVSGRSAVVINSPKIKAHIAPIIDRISANGTIGIDAILLPSMPSFTPPTLGTSAL